MTTVLKSDEGTNWKAVNNEPFLFQHSLQDHPLFETPRLIKLSERVANRGFRGQYFHDSDHIKAIPELKRKLAATIESMGCENHWFKLADVHEVDSDYKKLMHDILADVEVLTESKIPYSPETGVTVFMNSPTWWCLITSIMKRISCCRSKA